MTPIHAVILDVDGTLVDSNDAHARAWVDAFAEAGIHVPYERVRRAIGMGGDKLMPHVAGISEDSEQGRRISSRRGDIFTSRYLPQVRPFPRVRDLVQRFIRDGFTVVVASSAKKDELEPLLDIAGITDLLEGATSSDDADRSKPDPDIVQAALKRSRAPREMAVMIGDTPYDVEAAVRAGVAIVAVECGGWRREDLEGAIEVYPGPAELCDRYDGSLFASLAAACAARKTAPAQAQPGATRGIGRNRLVAGLLIVAAAAILVGVATSRRRRAAPLADDLPVARPGLGPRERDELRALIARTS